MRKKKRKREGGGALPDYLCLGHKEKREASMHAHPSRSAKRKKQGASDLHEKKRRRKGGKENGGRGFISHFAVRGEKRGETGEHFVGTRREERTGLSTRFPSKEKKGDYNYPSIVTDEQNESGGVEIVTREKNRSPESHAAGFQGKRKVTMHDSFRGKEKERGKVLNLLTPMTERGSTGAPSTYSSRRKDVVDGDYFRGERRGLMKRCRREREKRKKGEN